MTHRITYCMIHCMTHNVQSFIGKHEQYLNDMRNGLQEIKTGNSKKFGGKIPKTDAADGWMDGNWDRKWISLVPSVDFKNNDSIPVPNIENNKQEYKTPSKHSRQSMMVSTVTTAQGPPSARKGTNGFR